MNVYLGVCAVLLGATTLAQAAIYTYTDANGA